MDLNEYPLVADAPNSVLSQLAVPFHSVPSVKPNLSAING